jgi:hypothetical protein
MGYSAVSPSAGSAGIVEAYDVPNMVIFSYPQGLPTTVPPGAGTTFTVQVHGLGGATPIPETGQLHYSIDGEPFTDVNMVLTGSDTYEATLPGASCLSTYDYYFSVEEASAGIVTDPPSAPVATFSALAAATSQVALIHDFETDHGWIVDAEGDDNATAGIWNRMDPEGTFVQGTAVQPEDDRTPSPGSLCWVTDGRAGTSPGTYDVDGGRTTLTTPTFSVAGQHAEVSYWRWYSNDAGANPNEDVLIVEISNNDGATWQEVETVGPAGPQTGGGWFHHEFVVSDFVPLSSQMRVRFVASDEGASSLVEAAADDFKVTVFTCSPGDFDGDGDIDLDDHAALYDCLSGPTDPPTPTPPSTAADCLAAFDFDTDTDVDLADFAAFQAVLPAI